MPWPSSSPGCSTANAAAKRRAASASRACSMDSLQHPDVRFITALPVGKDEDSDDGPLDKLTAEELREMSQNELAGEGGGSVPRIAIPRATGIKINSIREIRREVPLSIAGQTPARLHHLQCR